MPGNRVMPVFWHGWYSDCPGNNRGNYWMLWNGFILFSNAMICCSRALVRFGEAGGNGEAERGGKGDGCAGKGDFWRGPNGDRARIWTDCCGWGLLIWDWLSSSRTVIFAWTLSASGEPGSSSVSCWNNWPMGVKLPSGLTLLSAPIRAWSFLLSGELGSMATDVCLNCWRSACLAWGSERLICPSGWLG